MTSLGQIAADTEMLHLDQVQAIIMAPIFTDENITSDYRIQTRGVHKDVESKLYVVGRRLYPLRRIDGCVIPEAEARAITQRTFKPVQLGYQNEWCGDEFDNEVFALLQGKNLDQYDLNKAPVLRALVAEMTMQENKNHLPLISWFGNVNSTNTKFNQLNGYFKLIQEAIGQGFGYHQTAYQGAALTAGQGIALVQSIVDNAPVELKGVAKANRVIYMSDTVYTRLKADLRLGVYGSDIYSTTIVNGTEIERFDGIEIRVRYEWDALLTDATLMNLAYANVAVMTVKRNLVWAINDTEGLSFEIFYDRYHMKTVVRNMFTFGCQFDYPELFSVAY